MAEVLNGCFHEKTRDSEFRKEMVAFFKRTEELKHTCHNITDFHSHICSRFSAKCGLLLAGASSGDYMRHHSLQHYRPVTYVTVMALTVGRDTGPSGGKAPDPLCDIHVKQPTVLASFIWTVENTLDEQQMGFLQKQWKE